MGRDATSSVLTLISYQRSNLSAAGNWRVEVGLSVTHSSRRANLATSMTTLECEPAPISLVPSVARTVNSICRPSTFVTSASPVTRRPTGVAARWRTLTAVPTALSSGSRYAPDRVEGGVFHDHDHGGSTNTGGRIASLDRSARCSGWARRLKEPLAPRGI